LSPICSASAGRSLGALCAHWTRTAGLGVELHHLPKLKWLHLPSRAGNGPIADVDLEVLLPVVMQEEWARAAPLSEHSSSS
jgi:hypothetical protein